MTFSSEDPGPAIILGKMAVTIVMAAQSHRRSSPPRAGTAPCRERSPTEAADLVKRRRGAVHYYFAQKMTVEPGTSQFLFLYTGHGREPQEKWSL